MHELSVATDIADLAFGAAQGRVIERLNIQNGVFSGVFADSLRFYLEILTEERQGRPAEVVIAETRARCVCECGRPYETDRFMEGCPACGGFKRKVEEGMDCRLESIEVADQAPEEDPPRSSQSPQSHTE